MSRVVDTDLGFRRALRRFREIDDLEISVGIDDPEVARYAAIHEVRTGYMRDTVDGINKGAMAAEIRAAAVSGRNAKAVAIKAAEDALQRIKQRVNDLGLVDTGLLIGSLRIIS